MKEDPAQRSRVMRAVKGANTGPEMIVRRLVHGMGYRYRLHRGDLPGKPDLVFPSRHKVIFVHGCFWHGHRCARGARVPVSNREYWLRKIARNKQRDKRIPRELRRLGWRPMVVWECETKSRDALKKRLRAFLES